MKKYLVLLPVLFCFLLLPSSVIGYEEIVEENVQSFDVDISINKEGAFEVVETIVYDFGNLERHGIYRDIPYSYTRNGAKYKVRLNIISVQDEKGNDWEYTTSRWSGQISIKIGDADKYVDGIKTYIVTYQVARAINFFEEHDELYWNVTGNEWDVPIKSISANIQLPVGIQADDWKLECYTGYLGSQGQECSYTKVNDKQALFESTRETEYEIGEGMTVVVGWPKGIVAKSTFWDSLGWFLSDNWPIFIPVIFLGIMIYLWYTRGRDPEGRGTIIPIYEAPGKLPAGEIGTVVDEKVDLRDISATIIQLAVNGYLKIKEIEKKKILGKKRDYKLIRLNNADNRLKDYERKIFKGIFSKKQEVNVSDLKNKFYVHLKGIKKSMYELVVQDGFFPTNPEKVRNGYTVVASFLVPFGFFFMVSFQGVWGGVIMVICGVIAIIFSRRMPRKTKQGVEMYEKIKGFELFLSVTEKERLKFHNAPERSPQQFENLLPYAMVLGVEKEWAKQFSEIYLTPPEWYEGGPGTVFGAWYLATSLGSLSTDLNSTLASRPGGSGGSGGSGFGGGGFSGGGFGGGGGGSW